MALLIYFKPENMNYQKYEDTIQRLEDAGAANPEGRIYHVIFGDSDELQVMDVWDSIENFENFGKILMPILQQTGIVPGNPEIKEVHKIIENKTVGNLSH